MEQRWRVVLGVLFSVSVASSQVSFGRWQRLAPPNPGAITAVAVASQDPDVFYVTSDPDGAWESRDGGATPLRWLWNGMGLFEVHMTRAAIAEADNNVRYTLSVGGALRRTTNGGGTWQNMGSPMGIHQNRPWIGLAVDPRDPYLILAGGDGYIMRSGDGGGTWTTAQGIPLGVLILDIEFVRQTSLNVVWAASSRCPVWESHECANGYSGGKGVFLSGDGGLTWYQRPLAPKGSDPKNHVNAVATFPGYPRIVFAATQGGLWVSPDWGASWTDYTPPGLASPNITDVAVVLTPVLTLYVGTEQGVFRGRWRKGTLRWATTQFPAAKVTALGPVLDDADRLYVGYEDGSVYRTSDAGRSVARVVGAHGAYSLATIAVPAEDEQTIYVGTVCQQGIFRVRVPTAATAKWEVLERQNRHFHYVMRVVASPKAPSTLYATEANLLWRSLDGGQTWQNRSPTTGVHLHGLAVAPSDPLRLYVATGHGNWGSHTNTLRVWRSTNGAGSWTEVTNNFPQFGTDTSLYDIEVAPNNPDWVYIATFGSENYPGDPAKGVGQGVVRTTNGGGSWQVVNQGLTTSLARYVGQIASTYQNGILYVYIATLDGLYVKRVRQGAETPWRDISPPGVRRFEAIAVDPVNPATLYAGTSETPGTTNPPRIYRSTNGGATWQRMSLPTPPLGWTGHLAWASQYRVRSLQATKTRVYAVIEGSGCYVYLKGPATP